MLIDSQIDMQAVFEASTIDEVLTAINDLTLDVLVVDQRMSGRDGIWLVENINQSFLGRGEWPPTMIVTAPYFAVELDIAVMRSGAADFVVEESGPEELLSAIRKACDENQSLDVFSLKELFDGLQLDRRSDSGFNLALANLDSGARSALDAFAAGLSDSEISQQLKVPQSSLKTLFREILVHFGFTSKEQLALALYESEHLA